MEQIELQRAIEAILFAAGERIEISRLCMALEVDPDEVQAAADALADELGSDTKYMRHGGYARMRGRGEKLEFLPVGQVLWFLLLCPNSSVSTAECFRALDSLRLQGNCAYFPRTQACIESLCALDKERVGRLMGNDLYQAALTLNSELLSVKEEADGFSPLGATMTGSGSGVIALFEERELCGRVSLIFLRASMVGIPVFLVRCFAISRV